MTGDHSQTSSGKSMRTRLRNWWRGELVDKPLAQQVPQLSEWFDTPCGRLLLESEQQIIDGTLPSLFGYHVLQMSVAGNVDLSCKSPIHHRVIVASQQDTHSDEASKAGLISAFESLPVESDSIDVVLLHHVLDFSPNPHLVLKEINRVLIPRGHVIIVGFNPFSLFGLWKSVASLVTRRPHWQYNGIAKKRLFDWFKLLDLEKTKIFHAFYRPPCRSALLLKRLSFLEKIGQKFNIPLGGVYVMVVRKDVCAVTPIRAPWEKNSSRLIGLSGARPSTPRIYRDTPGINNKDILH